jgi:uncharacterized membrane protein YadS
VPRVGAGVDVCGDIAVADVAVDASRDVADASSTKSRAIVTFVRLLGLVRLAEKV